MGDRLSSRVWRRWWLYQSMKLMICVRASVWLRSSPASSENSSTGAATPTAPPRAGRSLNGSFDTTPPGVTPASDVSHRTNTKPTTVTPREPPPRYPPDRSTGGSAKGSDIHGCHSSVRLRSPLRSLAFTPARAPPSSQGHSRNIDDQKTMRNTVVAAAFACVHLQRSPCVRLRSPCRGGPQIAFRMTDPHPF